MTRIPTRLDPRHQLGRDICLAIFTVIPGVVSLTGLSHGMAQLAQRIAASAFALMLLLRITYCYLVRRNAALRHELIDTSLELGRMRQAVCRVADRQKPCYEEAVELTFTIGRD